MEPMKFRHTPAESVPLQAQPTRDVAELQTAVYAVRRASVGGSNDDEIEKLQAALELALRRWDEVDATGDRCQHRPDDEDQDYCCICGSEIG